MRKLRTSVVTAIVGVTASFYMSAAFSHLAYSYVINYFSDATMTEQVGERYVGCNGATLTDGEVTAYTTISDKAGCGGGYECPSTDENYDPYEGMCF